MAVHAADLLRGATIYPTLREALADRDLSVGTSARIRSDLPMPQHPAQIRPFVRAATAPALVFGPEESGLNNADLEQCQMTVRIPTGDYASLNLAQAVLLVCYEFLQGQDEPLDRVRKTATREEMEAMYGHLHDRLHRRGACPSHPAPVACPAGPRPDEQRREPPVPRPVASGAVEGGRRRKTGHDRPQASRGDSDTGVGGFLSSLRSVLLAPVSRSSVLSLVQPLGTERFQPRHRLGGHQQLCAALRGKPGQQPRLQFGLSLPP